MLKKIGFLLLVAVIAAFFLFPKNKTEVTEQKNSVVKIGVLQLIGNWPFYVAERNRFFADKHIDVEFVNFQSSNQIMDALLRGDIDVSYFASLPVLAAQTTDPGKVRIFAFGDYSIENPFDALLVKKGSTIRALSDLSGKKIGVFPGTTGTNFVKKHLQNKGVDISKNEFIQLPPPSQLQALETGSIDALHAYELNMALALDRGLAETMDTAIFAQVLPNAAIGMVAASNVWIQKNPIVSVDFIDAYEKALAFVNTDESAVRDIVKEKFQLKDEVANAVTLQRFRMYDEYDFQIFRDLTSLSAEIGDLKSVPNVENLLYKR
ncbi:MAG: NrtA/SsuA/CpmA family ABC transporter substrate-binding protein [Parcubacteria group bacterium]|nr:NrtA/SsuA/CpmA family ABC transporter substrate-binding protein [Parcubacteria group bacterium]